MNVAHVMDEIGRSLKTISNLRVFSYVPGDVPVPAAIVGWPEETTFDLTYGRGSDRMTIPVIVLVSNVSDRTARDRLAEYLNGVGDRSIKAALDNGGPGVPPVYDSLRVMSAIVEIRKVGAVDYLAATFSVDVVG